MSFLSTIAMPEWSRTKLIVLHEMVHILADRYHGQDFIEGHGPQFATFFLDLVDHFLGEKIARTCVRLSKGTALPTLIETKENEMDEKERLTKAEQAAGLLASDLKDILTHTDNLPLEEIMLEAFQQVEKIRRRLKRFAGA